MTKIKREKKSKEKQASLCEISEEFDRDNWWKDHWKDMPEYSHQKLTPFKTLLVHFYNREDMEKFANLVGQRINLTTKSIYFPEIDREGRGVYVSESKEVDKDDFDFME